MRCPVNPSFFSSHPAYFPLFTSVQDHHNYLFVITYDLTSHHFLTSLNSFEQKIQTKINPGSLYTSIPAAEYDSKKKKKPKPHTIIVACKFKYVFIK